jgi:hypothetical protein
MWILRRIEIRSREIRRSKARARPWEARRGSILRSRKYAVGSQAIGRRHYLLSASVILLRYSPAVVMSNTCRVRRPPSPSTVTV